MTTNKILDVIIVGGSYAGLSTGMALGRSLRSVLIIDSGKPCNRQTPYSHNFITQDGVSPADIFRTSKDQVLKYPTVSFSNDKVISVIKKNQRFMVSTESGSQIETRKILFATGVKDVMPDLKGFADCWGISVLHCPYCHGYEVAHRKLGILANGESAFELCKLIQHWSPHLTLFTDGNSTLTADQNELLRKLDIKIVEKEIEELRHNGGKLTQISFKDHTSTEIEAIFSRVPFEQHCVIPQQLGCEMNEQGFFEVDLFQKTNVEGVFCAGDNTTFFRSVSIATAAGTKAGAAINMELLNEALTGK